MLIAKEKKMKKRIGTKIMVLLGILSLFFLGFSLANVMALSEINEKNSEIADIYLQLQKIDRCQYRHRNSGDLWNRGSSKRRVLRR